MLDRITVHGARQHNLKNIDVEIPRNKLTVITGLSGSGKSSLAFDTIYAEGQRRYVETLSTYARQFLDQMERPDVDSIDGLSPAISIEQKTTSRSPRSTVGTITEDVRLSAAAVLVHRRAALPTVRQRDLAADHRADPAPRAGAQAGGPHHGDGAGGARPQGRVQERPGKAGAAGFLAGADRRRAAFARRRHSPRQAEEPYHRSSRGPAAGEARGSKSGWKLPSKPPPSWRTGWC